MRHTLRNPPGAHCAAAARLGPLPAVPAILSKCPTSTPQVAGLRGHGLVVLPLVHRSGSLGARAAGPPRPPWSLSGAPWPLGCGLEALRALCALYAVHGMSHA